MKITPEIIEQVAQEGKKIRLELFQKLCEVQEGHPGSILSIFDVVNALYLSGQIRVVLMQPM